MSKASGPLAERIHENEVEVDSLRVSVGKLEERVAQGFGRVEEKIDTTNTKLDRISDQVVSLATVEKERELSSLRKKWGITTKILGAIGLTVLGGFMKWLIDKIVK